MTIDVVIEKANKLSKSEEAFRTIGEVSLILKVEQYVIRFWESKFKQLHPYKNRGIRYYSKDDISLLQTIKKYLYEEGYTIKGAQQLLSNSTLTNPDSKNTNQIDLGERDSLNMNELKTILTKLMKMRDNLKQA